MSFACVRGGRECDGCMACQEVDDSVDLSEATRTIDDCGKDKKIVVEKLSEIRDILTDMRDTCLSAMESIPPGYEDTQEFGSLEHNVDRIDAALDWLDDVDNDVDALIG